MVKNMTNKIRNWALCKLVGEGPLIQNASSFDSSKMSKKEIEIAKRETLEKFQELLLEHCDVTVETIYGWTVIKASFFVDKVNRKVN